MNDDKIKIDKLLKEYMKETIVLKLTEKGEEIVKRSKEEIAELHERMISLRREFEICKSSSPDTTVIQRACRNVIDQIFEACTWGITESKLDKLEMVLENYKEDKL